ncbi:2481_t:CDS:1 [Funneliformis mosseae]|uniref:2481_t:CDS:1 n=1 Tax=Funneliformis mosseae TaxID=27381 RepID=A0A9N9EFU4_FUNMO|nr:2481_t:CDS:1 [Funneliformis mosseae]
MGYLEFLQFLPKYVVGSLSAIAIMGDSPYDFYEKTMWFFRCFGCPFDGLLHSLIGGEKVSCCLYWLSSNYFKLKNNEDSNDNGTHYLKYRPFGFYAMKLNKDDKEQNERINKYVKRCTANLPVLERISLFITSYYIIFGVIEGVSMMYGKIFCEEWAYLPLLFSWTIPVIWKRGKYGVQVVIDPKLVFKNIQIIVDENPTNKFPFKKRVTVTITALLSIVYPWVTVIIVYFTPPVGYYCRSKYVTLICVIWSFNSALAYFWHIKGESDLIMSGNGWLHVWFCTSGFIVAILVLFLGIFTGYNTLWVDYFGDACDLSSIGCY